MSRVTRQNEHSTQRTRPVLFCATSLCTEGGVFCYFLEICPAIGDHVITHPLLSSLGILHAVRSVPRVRLLTRDASARREEGDEREFLEVEIRSLSATKENNRSFRVIPVDAAS